MGHAKTRRVLCQLSRREVPLSEAVAISMVHGPLVEEARRIRPDLDPEGYISIAELNRLRLERIETMLGEDRGELGDLESQVLDSLQKHELLTRDVNKEFDRTLSVGERLADHIATFGGSWGFITLFGATLVAWIALNVAGLFARPFDPYPFILLNLVLSCLAAIQAPVIMMSQNRQEDKDRLRSEHDYRVNLKAELEVRLLHEKMDHLLHHELQRLLEIQEIQTEMLHDLGDRPRTS
jgi:uncharacterized membrane protein